jgi:hypothetical protein
LGLSDTGDAEGTATGLVRIGLRVGYAVVGVSTIVGGFGTGSEGELMVEVVLFVRGRKRMRWKTRVSARQRESKIELSDGGV